LCWLKELTISSLLLKDVVISSGRRPAHESGFLGP
jgi:hypothetical protein